MDTDDLRIRRWGDIGDGYLGPAFHARFRPGQVLYGSRRTYLRKVAVADFDGICANTTFVLEPHDPKVLLPELLPFIMQTEAFHEHSKRESKGSVNPYVNFSDLAWYEFVLPPLEEQRRSIRMLRASTDCLATARTVAIAAESTEQAEIQWWFREKVNWKSAPMHRLGQVQLGQQKHPKYETGLRPMPYLRVPNVTDGYLKLDEIAAMDFVGRDFEKHRLQIGDIIVTEGDLIGPRNVGRSAIFRGEIEDCCVQKTLLRFRPGPSLNPDYTLWAFRHLRYDGVFAKASTGTTVAHLTSEKFKEVLMPVAPVSLQVEIAAAAARWIDTRERVRERIRRAEDLHRGHLEAPWSQ